MGSLDRRPSKGLSQVLIPPPVQSGTLISFPRCYESGIAILYQCHLK